MGQENIRTAINKALTAAVPITLRRAGGAVGPPVYTATDNPGAILLDFQRRYRKATLTKKTAAEASWKEAWNPGDKIETIFLKLEELFVQAIITVPAYTNSQLIDCALSNVKQMVLYMTAVQDWNALP